MNIDKVFLYVVYLYLNFRTAYNISLLSIVHFKCSSYFIKSEKCCVGTIYPNFILTSVFCAESCDTVLMKDMKIPINNIFIHPRYKKYVEGQHILETNDIVLVMVTSHPKAVTLKLSAMEVISAIGLKALIPILDDNKPRLLVTVIQSCSKHLLLRGYHICSIGTLCNRVFNNCQYTNGLPLLIDGQIVGLTGLLSSKLCNFPQKIFTAVGPIIPWIRSFIINNREDSLQNSFQDAERFDKLKLQTINLQNIDLKSGYKQFQQKEITIPTKNSTSYNLYSKMQETNMNILPSIRKLITSSTLYETLIKSVLKTKYSVPIKKNITELTYFTQIPDTNLLKTSESFNISSTYSARRFATNAMDWFNKNVRNKLKDKPPPLLVLTTPRINYNKEFVDLT
ncbi:uncharacterized protein LOC116413300 [Galleria mellonella]|uniref:Uncharacterized protein LOC116413300 n=1 Tax=Galleria mellonella TaxID=7137 RepID=A0A6J3C6R5_GALME|nr:uncharacterized protein LOC116413300 [Galleria mellonella]